MVVHGKFKIMSNIEYILKYLENTFPEVKEQLFDPIKNDNFKKLVKWHQNNLKPRCEILINLHMQQKVSDDEKKREVSLFEKLLKKLDEQLKDSGEDYFSGCDKMSAIDIILHSDIATIVYMYSLKEKLSDKEYPSL